MKSVLISTRPKWVAKICHKIGEDETGKAIYEKRIEVRKSAPKEVPFKAYIYCCKDNANEIVLLKNYKNRFIFGDYRNADDKFYRVANGKVIGEFICDKVYPIKNRGSSFSVADEEQSVTNEIARQSCLYYDYMVSYFGNKDGYGWHISDLKIYDKPRNLSEFGKVGFGHKVPLKRPPQSWMYIEDLGEEK